MEALQTLLSIDRQVLVFLAALAGVTATLAVARYVLERRYAELPEGRFRIQLTLAALTVAGLLAIVACLPVTASVRIELLKVIGLLFSAAITLSSTTFFGNAMAGVLLRVVRAFKLGDFIRVGDNFGRASERGLFHTEIQTEDRDLTTLPNLYLVTHPMTVVRASGTIVSATVSLGYDVPRSTVAERLLAAAEGAGLVEPFVQILELGDFSVTYRIAGLLEEVTQVLSARSKLRGAMLDELHGAGIEIVSPSFMNQRQLGKGELFVPPAAAGAPAEQAGGAPESIVFDKAEAAASLEQLKTRKEELAAKLDGLRAESKGAAEEQERGRVELKIAQTEQLAERLGLLIRLREDAREEES